MKLLLVDDNIVDRIATKRILGRSDLDLEITEVETGEQAIEAVSSNDYDIILLDYNLPGINGLQVFKQMTHGSIGQTAVIFLSGEKNEFLATSCLEQGAQDFLQKDKLTHEHLLKAITHARLRHQHELALEHSRQEMQVLAECDQLTGLLNRYAFESKVNQLSRDRRRNECLISIMLLDLDNFKWLNDSFGHDTGDKVLQTVAQRLKDVCREDDLICRLGGDEFAIALINDHQKNSFLVAQRIFEDMAPSLSVENREFIVTCSIGIADFRDNNLAMNDVLKQADLAMYKAKSEGRNRLHYFHEHLQSAAVRRINVENELRKAIKADQITVYYQPQIETHTTAVCGAEALVRWHHPQKGLRTPGYFMDIAEDCGLIVAIDRLVFGKACEQLKLWHETPNLLPDEFKLAVNISARTLLSENFIPSIKETLDFNAIKPQQIELEIVESQLVQDFNKAQSVIDQLEELGVSVAIDDFGTGYSSLSYLKILKVKTLKVDRSFLSGVPKEPIDCRLLKGLLNLAHSLELTNVVEGVETIEQLKKCIEYRANKVQGYFISHPLPKKDFEIFLRSEKSLVEQLA